MCKPLESELKRIVDHEVYYCVSYLVNTLACNACIDGSGSKELSALYDKASELCMPLIDDDETALQNDIEVRHDMAGYYVCTIEEAEHEDAGNPSVGFDGRDHFDTITDAIREYCYDNDIEFCEREIYEHWIVSDWLADKLEAKGERVDRDFAGLTVWGRTTTGQAIYMDSVIERIWRDCHAPVV